MVRATGGVDIATKDFDHCEHQPLTDAAIQDELISKYSATKVQNFFI